MNKKSKKKVKNKAKKSKLFLALKILFILFIWLVITLSVLAVYYLHDMPDVDSLSQERKSNITFLTEDGEFITKTGEINGNYVEFKEFPDHLVKAVIATEDRRFFDHFGVDLFGLLRAIIVNLRTGRLVQGGSTITQQLAKNLFLTPDRTVKRKVQEMILAFYLEEVYSKEEILTLYLNKVYLGGGNYGVDSASRFYFNKTADQLSLRESSIIAGLLKAPSRYAPTTNPELSKKRSDQVLINMVDAGFLDVNSLLKEDDEIEIIGNKFGAVSENFFIDWILEQLPDYIGNVNKDIIVTTTYDPYLQNYANFAVEDVFLRAKKSAHGHQVAMVAMKPNGAIKAMIGGRNYKQSQFNRAVKAYRQSGSAFKVFVYLAAVENGILPEDIYIDEPVKFEEWEPKNYNNKYLGEVTVEKAFAKSINSVALKLAEEIGIKKIIDTAKRLGISSNINRDFSSVLGTSELTLLELTNAYAHFANNGKVVIPYGIIEIKDVNGNIYYQRNEIDFPPIIEEENLNKFNKMLEDVINKGTGKRAKFDYPAAAKTGTSQDFRDAVFVGFTADYVAGVWVGNDDNTPMENITGGSLPALIWKGFMEEAHQGLEKKDIHSYTTKKSVLQKFLDNLSE